MECVARRAAACPARHARRSRLLRNERIPSLVASGGHAPALERICDALATALSAERLVAPGAGHFVAAAPGFTDRLEQFLLSAA